MQSRSPGSDSRALVYQLPAQGSERDLELGGLIGLGLFLLLVLTGRDQDLLPSPVRLGLVLAWPFVPTRASPISP